MRQIHLYLAGGLVAGVATGSTLLVEMVNGIAGLAPAGGVVLGAGAGVAGAAMGGVRACRSNCFCKSETPAWRA